MILRLAALALLPALAVQAAEWDRFRGPNGSGVADGQDLPVEFGPKANVAWKAAVPFSRSSPIVAGGRVFLTALENNTLLTLAFDATSGRPLWRRAIVPPKIQAIYKANDPASATPAASADTLFVFFPDVGLIAYSFDGKERWRLPMGPFTNFYGLATSPVVANGMVLLLCDQQHGAFLLAVDAATGKQRWKLERPESPDGWSVPIVYQDQIVAVGSSRVDGIHLATGEKRWWLPLKANGAMGSPVLFGDTVLVTSSGYDDPWLPAFESTLAKLDKDADRRLSLAECAGEQDWFEHFGWIDANRDGILTAAEWNEARQYGIGDYGAVAIPLSGKGKLESSALRWRMKRNLPYVPSPVLYDGVFYMVKSGGIVTSMDPATGKVAKQGRTQKALGSYWASPVAAAGKIYAASEEGKVSVLRAGPQWEVLAVNDLGEEIYATPAISGGRLFIRTRGTLYSFAAAKP